MKMYRGIWYNEKLPQMSLESAFQRDRGKLVIDGDVIEYHGKKRNLRIESIEALDFGLQGTNPVNPFIKVTYKDGFELKTAYFTDGKLFGYSGIFGGSYRIFRRLSELVSDERKITSNHSYVITHVFLLLILVTLILKVLVF